MPSKLRAPQESGEIGRVVQKIYDDLNSIIESINTDIKGLNEPLERSKAGSIAVVKEGNSYSLRGKTADGWAKVPIRLLNSSGMKSIFESDKFNDIEDISVLTDALDGATFTGETLTTSSTPTVDELEACSGSLAGKINELVEISNTHNDRINTLIDKVNDITRRINE